MSILRKKFSQNLKKQRINLNLTQEDLAEKANISVRYIQLLESSKVPNVKLDTIYKFSKI